MQVGKVVQNTRDVEGCSGCACPLVIAEPFCLRSRCGSDLTCESSVMNHY